MMANHLTQNCTPTTIHSYHKIIPTLDTIRANIHKIATCYSLEFEDVYQQAALLGLECLDKGKEPANFGGYIAIALRNHYSKKFKLTISCVSLETPVRGSHEDDILLADTLPQAPTENIPSTQAEKRIAALYNALPLIPIDEQAYLANYLFYLNYTPIITPGVNQMRSDRTRQQISATARTHIRKLVQL
jgi:hypothetical protein